MADFHALIDEGYQLGVSGGPLVSRLYDRNAPKDLAYVAGWRFGNRQRNPPKLDPFAGYWPDTNKELARFNWTPKR